MAMWHRSVVTVVVLAGSASTAVGQVDTARVTASRRAGLVSGGDLKMFAAFVGATALALPLDAAIARQSQSTSLQGSGLLSAAADGFRNLGGPGTIVVTAGLFAVGKLCGCRGMARAGLHSMEALAIAAGATQILKLGVGRARPGPSVGLDPGETGPDPDIFRPFRGSGGYTAFPSGHASAAFAVAATLSAEWPDAPGWVSPSLYGAATLVGLSRVYNNRHWASDVIVGAMLGTYVGRKVVARQQGGRRAMLAPSAVVPMGDGVAVFWRIGLKK
jgi:membrane-associated phospholipid phosphatase